jgi:Squalene-hopene cyclase C-terminal domain
MSTRDAQEREGASLPPRAPDRPPTSPAAPDIGQLPPQAPVIPQVPHPTNVPSQATPIQPAPATPVTAVREIAADEQVHEDSEFASTIAQWRDMAVDLFTRFAIPNAPPWMVSMVIHLALILILALVALPQIIESTYVVEVSYAEDLGEQLLDDTQFIEAIEPLEIDPALTIDDRAVEDPLASSAPPEIKVDFLDSPSETEAPSIGLALSGREPGSKRAMLAAYGGTGETENSVEMALDWLKRNQKRDGTWSLAGPYKDGVSGTENQLAATSMAMLAFQGAGNTHQSGEYAKIVERGMKALLKMQDRDGNFFASQKIQASHQLYSQAQATIVICELYGMTEDSRLRAHAQQALDYAVSIQADDRRGGGGWRYQPGSGVDTSVTGWFVIALKSGEMGGLSVPSPVKDRINRYLDNSTAEPSDSDPFVRGSRYLYRVGEREDRVSMTAEALLCRQYLGWSHNDPRLLAGVQHIGEHPIDWNKPHVYYWYYATQVMHHIGGDPWEDWNNVMRKALPAAQVKTGRERGSWSPAGDQFGYTGGRLFMTCLSTYMLEVYYRHMPIYQH